MFKGAYHELTKEEDRHSVFSTVLKYIGTNLQSGKAFGEIKPTDFKFAFNAVKKSSSKNKKWRILLRLIVLYLAIGILRLLRRGGSKSASLLFWPLA